MSFWDDLIIGEGSKGNSAVKVRDVGATHISQNSVAYWISRCYLDIGVTIFKDTPEGEQLTAMLFSRVEDEQISSWLDALVLTRMPPTVLREKIEDYMVGAFNKGRQYQADRIRATMMGGD